MVTRDVSVGGMFINVGMPLPVGSQLSLTFRLSPTEPSISCRGKVVFSSVGLGMGVSFLDLSPEGKLALERFVDRVP